jgi:hypothetical protein
MADSPNQLGAHCRDNHRTYRPSGRSELLTYPSIGNRPGRVHRRRRAALAVDLPSGGHCQPVWLCGDPHHRDPAPSHRMDASRVLLSGTQRSGGFSGLRHPGGSVTVDVSNCPSHDRRHPGLVGRLPDHGIAVWPGGIYPRSHRSTRHHRHHFGRHPARGPVGVGAWLAAERSSVAQPSGAMGPGRGRSGGGRDLHRCRSHRWRRTRPPWQRRTRPWRRHRQRCQRSNGQASVTRWFSSSDADDSFHQTRPQSGRYRSHDGAWVTPSQ